jgi:O-antigen ligase
MSDEVSGHSRAPTMSKVNIWYNQLFYGLSAIAGSTTSFFLNGALIWAFVRLAQRRISLASDQVIRSLAVIFALYPLSEVLSVVLNGRGKDGLVAALGQIVFLAILPISSRLILSKPNEILSSAAQGAASAGIIAFVYSLFEFLTVDIGRAEAGYGNSVVAGVVALVLAAICVVALPMAKAGERLFLAAGAFSASGALLLSGTRSAWLAAPVSLALASMPYWGAMWRSMNLKRAAITLCVAAVLAGVAAPLAVDRLYETLESAEVAEAGGYDKTFGDRYKLWSAGYRQVSEDMWTGYGPDSVRAMIQSIKPEGSLGYSHYHNFVLNSLIRGGVLELLALLAIPAGLFWLAVKPSQNAYQRAGKALLLSLCATFYSTGLVGILFTHDIMNAVFVYTAIIGICLATGAYAPEREITTVKLSA